MEIALSIPGIGNIDSGVPVPTGGLAAGQNILFVFINLFVVLAILASLGFLLRGGLDIIMSRGQKEKLKSGRERVLYALLGLVLIFLSFTMIGALSAFFGTDLLCILFKTFPSCK